MHEGTCETTSVRLFTFHIIIIYFLWILNINNAFVGLAFETRVKAWPVRFSSLCCDETNAIKVNAVGV